MTGTEYQRLAMRTCNVPFDQRKSKLYHKEGDI